MGTALAVGAFVGSAYLASRSSDSAPAPSVEVSVPGPTETELRLQELQLQILEQQQAGPSPEEQALIAKQQEYYNRLIAEQTLSPTEEAEFEREYDLQLEALEARFGIESERYGGQQYAGLVGRGMLETTTGEVAIAEQQQRFADLMMGQKTQMLQQKELAKSDMEAAKLGLAQAGYQLTSSMSQQQTQTALEAAMGMQGYLMQEGGMRASTALQNALMDQAINKAAYNQKMNMWGSITGIGMGLTKGAMLAAA